MSNHRYDVLIADDHQFIAENCKSILEPEFNVIGIVNDGRELLRVAIELEPDLVVLDISMPILNGLDAGRQLKAMRPNVKLVYLSIHSTEQIAAEAMLLGASGYVVKTCAGSELVIAIRSVLQGEQYLSYSLSRDKVNSLVWERKGRKEHGMEITAREDGVLQLIAEGLQMKEVGDRLGIRTRTVAFHKYRMMGRLGIKNNADLISYAKTRAKVRASLSTEAISLFH